MKRVLANCMYCRRRNAKPGEQIMAELPPARLQMNSHPFAYTGVDYFGALMIRQKRSNVKRYGCLFTCHTTRAVHLEVSVDLSSDAFINALRRFLSRRGPVVHIILLLLLLFAIFIIHSRESELYRYTLDGKSALAWELPFLGHLSST